MNIFSYLNILFYALNFVIMFSLVFYKRERPEKVLGWLLVLVFLPPVGLVLYFLMGINWRDTVLNERYSPAVAELINQSLGAFEGPNEDVARMVSNLNATPLFHYNEITLYKDGIEKFEALIQDIREAQDHIHMEYYIVKSDDIGRRVFDALKERALAGVKVRVIMDKVGGLKFDKDYKEELMKAGIQIVTYTATFAFVSRLIDLSLNYRNHRKMVIIDGKIGYIGGNNIGDEYVSKGSMGYWRDTHMRVEGDFVLGMQGLFYDDFFAVLHRNQESKKWEYMKQREIYLEEEDLSGYFQPSKITNELPMQICYSGPESALYSIELLYLKMIATARERIFISTPYFIPSEATMSALKAAIVSGIDVRIMFPAQYDHFMVGHASMTYLGELIEIGARVFLYRDDAFTHNKAMVCDGRSFTMGTANFDVRSFFFNYEVNAVVYDEYYAAKMEGFFHEDMDSANELTLEKYLARPKLTVMKESFFRVFSLLF